MTVSRKKKIFIAIATAAFIALAVMIVAGAFTRRNGGVGVETAKVERRAVLESKVMANGEVRPIQFINLTAEVSGRVVDVFVKEGDQVKKGQPLLRVDPTQLASSASIQEAALRASRAENQNQTVGLTAAENGVNAARAALDTLKADLDRAKAERSNAEMELKRNAALLESGVTSRSAYETAKLRFDSAIASVEAAAARVEQSKVQLHDAEIRVRQAGASLDLSKARVAQQQASLDQASDQLKRATQYATIDGVVVGPIVQVGTYAIANFQSTGLLLIADMSVINVEVRVDETDVANVKVGQKANVKVEALGDLEVEGEIVEKAAAAQTRTGQTIAQTAVAASQEAKDFRVVVRLNHLSEVARGGLRPGMSATAVITTDRRENIIAVPLQSLVERDQRQLLGERGAVDQNRDQNPKENKTLKGVFVLDHNKAIFTPVSTGITGENDIEIKSGLKEGQEIVTGPYRQLRTLRNDQPVKPEDSRGKAGRGESKT
jgi:HlyD family secretion protein